MQDIQNYYDSDWYELKKVLLLRSHGKCERCGSNIKLQVHHKDGSPSTYHDFDSHNFELLCDDCHSRTYQAVSQQIQKERDEKLVNDGMYEFVVDRDNRLGTIDRNTDGSLIIRFVQTDTGARANVRVQDGFKNSEKVYELADYIESTPDKTIRIFGTVATQDVQTSYGLKRFNNIKPQTIVVL